MTKNEFIEWVEENLVSSQKKLIQCILCPYVAGKHRHVFSCFFFQKNKDLKPDVVTNKIKEHILNTTDLGLR